MLQSAHFRASGNRAQDFMSSCVYILASQR
jgi:hypothetical protein